VLLEQATNRHLGGLLHLPILPRIRRTCNVGYLGWIDRFSGPGAGLCAKM